MNAKERRRQLKKAKHNLKRKAKQKAIARVANMGLAATFTRYAKAPIHECLMNEDIWNSGMGHVILSRKLPDGRFVLARFLVDVYCLGVKDAIGSIFDESKYEDFFDFMDDQMEMVKIAPAFARKLIEGAVEYAASVGLQPHPNYAKVKPIFGEIETAECRDEFKFGCNGRPLFFAGPNDDLAKCYAIAAKLEETLGAGNFDVVLPMGHGSPSSYLSDDFEDELDEYDDDE